MSKYQALIDAMGAPGLTDCLWVACGPSFGAPRPVYLNEVVAASDDEDDIGPLETVCRAPLGSKDECTADMAYIAEANPSTIRALLADLERAERLAALAQQAQPVAWMLPREGDEQPIFREPGDYPFANAGWTPVYTTPPAPPVPAPVDEREAWLPIESAPKTGCTLLLGFFNSCGKWRTIRGQWMSQSYIDEYWEEPEDGEPGWHETVVESDDMPNCWRTNPTHWMPLPPAPQATKGQS